VSEIRLKRNPALHKILEQSSVTNVVLEELKQNIRDSKDYLAANQQVLEKKNASANYILKSNGDWSRIRKKLRELRLG
jgi:hypothetical protein